MNIKTILKYCIYATAFMPLIIFSQYMSPFHFGKVVVFRSIIEIMLALYLILILKDRTYLPRRNNVFWAFLGFALAYTLATVTSINVFQSFWGTLERMGGAWTFWHYFVFYVILISVLRTRKEWFTFLKITVGVGVLSAFYGFGQRTDITFFIGSGGRERIFGTIGNAALFAGYQILNVFIALMIAFTAERPKTRSLFLIAAGIMGIAVFMTAVRGSILGLTIGLLVLSWFYFLKTHSQMAKKIFIGGLGIIIVFVAFGLTFKNSQFVQRSNYLKRVTDFSPSSLTVQTRFWAWQAGLKGWSEGPKTVLVGWGPENFNIPFSKYFNPKFFGVSETLFDRAHNMFVEVLVTTGAIGLLAYLTMFGSIFLLLKKIKNKPKDYIPASVFIAMLVAYIIHNSFIFDTSANFIAFFSVLGFISFMGDEDNVLPAQNNKSKLSPTLVWFLGIVLMTGAIILVYQTNIQTAKGNYAATRAIIAGWNNDFNGAVAKFKESVAYDVPGKYEYRNRFAQYLLDYSAASSVDITVPNVQVAFKDAIAMEEKNAVENPKDYLPELYLSRLNITLGKSDPKSPYNDESLKHSLKALSYSETFVRTYYEVGQGYLNKKDYENAKVAFQKAVDLNPEVGTSYWYLGMVEMQMGQVNNALTAMDMAIKYGYALNEKDYLNLASIYVQKNDFQHLVTIYEGLMKLKPTSAQYKASLAVVYSKVGRIDDAVRMARLAAQMDPNFEPEAIRFVESLGRTW